MHPLIKATKKLSGHRLIFVTEFEKYKRAKSLVLSRDRSNYFLFGGPIFDSENSENRHCIVLKSWRHKIMGFVRIFWKNNIQEAFLPKMSILV